MSELSIHVYCMIRTPQCAKDANSRQSLKTLAPQGYRVAFFILVRVWSGTSIHINQSIDQIPPLTLLSTAAVVTMVGGAALFTDFDLAPHAHLPPLYWNVTPTSSQPAHLDS